jgi:Carboxypeptidase regulatory-like domain/TonB-dependent Receptor Plug Domain
MKNYVRIAALVVPLLFASSSFAQFENAEVLGAVHDPAGDAVAKASVTLLNQDTGIEAKTTTDDSGNYDFFNAKVGKYTVTVEATGFSKVSTRNVDVVVGARQRVDLTLQIGAVTQSVEVSDVASVLETDSSEHGQVINTQQVVSLPLNGRNYSDLALLATNVHRSVINTALNGTPREGSFNANGMRSTYNNFLMDGMDNNAYSTSNQGFSNQVAQPSPDAVQEFKVVTSNFSAEYGRVGGAVVNVVMRSGTNQIHGTAYEFLRNTDLNAIGYVFGARPATFKKPTLQRNQFGATVGGPLIKNKLFYFGDYEGYRNLQKVLNFDTLPSLTDRAGILPVDVVNPATGVLYKAGTTIPMTSFASQVLNALPAPTGAGRASNYQALLLTRDYTDKYDAKLDDQIGSRMSAFLRFDQRKSNQFYQPDIPGPSGGNGNGNLRALSQAAAAGYTWTVTPTSILEIRMGFTHITGGKFPVFLGGPSLQSLYGATGLPTSSNLTGGLDTQSVGGFAGFGRQATNPQFQNPTTFAPKATYSWNRGAHAIKAGVEMGIIHTEVMDINPVYGVNAYSGQFSRPSASAPADSTSYNLADFYFGLPSQVQLANFLIGSYRQQQYFGFLQDDYHVSRKLTVNLGVRWEFATPRWERDNVLSNFNPATNSILTASNGSLYNRTLVNPDYKDWAPRLGAAYSFDSKTVVRGGYGISYVHLNRLGSADELGINGPQVNIATVNQTVPFGGPLPAGFIQAPNFPAGIATPAGFNPVNANIAYIPANTRWPYVQTWFFSLQREVLKDTVVELGYSGNHSLRVPILADFNQAVPNAPGGTLGIQARRPDQSFGAITWVDSAGQQSYNGFSVRVEHRMSHGLFFLNSFTWSKSLGNTEQALENAGGPGVANIQNVYNLKAERGPSSYDEKFINVATVVYQLPFGKGRAFGNSWNPVIDSILGGWDVNVIDTANTGLPMTVSYTPTAANDVTGRIPDYRGLSVMRPNLVGNPNAGGNGLDPTNFYLDKTAFAIPSSSAPFGNLGRNVFRAPGFQQMDININKNFKLPFRENTELQFRSEFFNIMNHTNFGFPTLDITSAAFGQIRSTYAPRQIQFALKLMF